MVGGEQDRKGWCNRICMFDAGHRRRVLSKRGSVASRLKAFACRWCGVER